MQVPQTGEIWKTKTGESFFKILDTSKNWVKYTRIYPDPKPNYHDYVLDVWLEKFEPARAVEVAKLRRDGHI